MTPEEIARIIDLAKARGVASLSFERGGAKLAFALHPELPPEQKNRDHRFDASPLDAPNVYHQRARPAVE